MTISREQKDLEFAYKIKRALDESTENISTASLDRLAAARKMAISRKKAAAPVAVFASRPAFAGSAGNSGFSFQGPGSWLGKFGIVMPLLVLVLGLFGIYEYESQQRIHDLAEIDVAVLVDELPPDAYLDTGFSAYLNKTEE